MARDCVICGAVDEEARDVVILADQSTAYHHIECGSRITPPCEGCAAVMAATTEGS